MRVINVQYYTFADMRALGLHKFTCPKGIIEFNKIVKHDSCAIAIAIARGDCTT